MTVGALGGDRHDLVLAELERLAGVPDEGGDVGAEEVLAVAEADDQRAVAAGADDHAGLVLACDGQQGEGARRGRCTTCAHRLGQVAGRARSAAPAAGRRPRCRSRTGTPRPSACRARPCSAWKFSMMPLWISASLPSSPPRWGWALASVGPPWVAQRVCPMPVRGRRAAARSAIASSRLASLPARLRVATCVAVDAARRRPSRTRGTRAGRGPPSRRRAPCRRRSGRRNPRFHTWAAA